MSSHLDGTYADNIQNHNLYQTYSNVPNVLLLRVVSKLRGPTLKGIKNLAKKINK